MPWPHAAPTCSAAPRAFGAASAPPAPVRTQERPGRTGHYIIVAPESFPERRAPRRCAATSAVSFAVAHRGAHRSTPRRRAAAALERQQTFHVAFMYHSARAAAVPAHVLALRALRGSAEAARAEACCSCKIATLRLSEASALLPEVRAGVAHTRPCDKPIARAPAVLESDGVALGFGCQRPPRTRSRRSG